MERKERGIQWRGRGIQWRGRVVVWSDLVSVFTHRAKQGRNGGREGERECLLNLLYLAMTTRVMP